MRSTRELALVSDDVDADCDAWEASSGGAGRELAC